MVVLEHIRNNLHFINRIQQKQNNEQMLEGKLNGTEVT
jgi:hypothetical protein